MSTDRAGQAAVITPLEQLRYGRDIIRHEADSLLALSQRLDSNFCRAVELLHACRGSVIVSGIGKAGLVGQKIAATLASMGTRSHFLHPVEAMHGDLGRIHREDLVLMLSHSGQTEEVVRLLPILQSLRIPVIAVTGRRDSPLGRAADVPLELGPMAEAGVLRLAPSTSTTAMLALGDALALVTSWIRGFTADDFARFHPGGSLGRRLAKVRDVMRPRSKCRVAEESQTIRQVLIQVGRPGRRTGAVMLTASGGRLTGIFTDSDLARLFESRRDWAIDEPIQNVMTRDPITISQNASLGEAIDCLAARKISELPVIDQQQHPCGLIDVTDLVPLLPALGRQLPPELRSRDVTGAAESVGVVPFSSPNASKG